MKIEKITVKPPVFEAVQQTIDNIADIKKWMMADEIEVSSDLGDKDELKLEVSYTIYEPDHDIDVEAKVYDKRTFTTKVYDFDSTPGLCGNDWVVNFGGGSYQVLSHGEFRKQYAVETRPLDTRRR